MGIGHQFKVSNVAIVIENIRFIGGVKKAIIWKFFITIKSHLTKELWHFRVHARQGYFLEVNLSIEWGKIRRGKLHF